jgi:hypothetical protein
MLIYVAKGWQDRGGCVTGNGMSSYIADLQLFSDTALKLPHISRQPTAAQLRRLAIG